MVFEILQTDRNLHGRTYIIQLFNSKFKGKFTLNFPHILYESIFSSYMQKYFSGPHINNSLYLTDNLILAILQWSSRPESAYSRTSKLLIAILIITPVSFLFSVGNSQIAKWLLSFALLSRLQYRIVCTCSVLAKTDAFPLIPMGLSLTMSFVSLFLVLQCFIKLNSVEVLERQFNPLKMDSRSQYGYACTSVLQCFVLNTTA